MVCQACGADVEEGLSSCPKCFAEVRRPGLFRRLADWLFKSGSGGAAYTTRTVVGTNVSEKFFFVDTNTGERREFDSFDDVPPEIRQKIEQARASGEPVKQEVSFAFRGMAWGDKTYRSLEEMPPEVRKIYEQVILPEMRARVPGLLDLKPPSDTARSS